MTLFLIRCSHAAGLRRSSTAALLLFAAGSVLAQPPQPAPRAPSSPYGAGAEGAALVIRNAADALGMVRGLGPRETLDAINRLQFTAEGSEKKSAVRVTVAISLHQDAVRIDKVSQEDGKTYRRVQVVAENRAWDEKTPGIEPTPAPSQTKQRRLYLAMLPQGFLRAVLRAPPKEVEVVGNGAGATISLPYQGMRVRATLDADYRPTKIQAVQSSRVVAEMDFENYKDFDEYEVFFPSHIVEKRNGSIVSDLKVTEFHTAPYVVFDVRPDAASPSK
jgi:hypothetical protein